jgi:hypothetical protein
VNEPCDPPPAENPFSARQVRPGAVPFRFPAGRSAGALVERLKRNHWRGQIVGPHGSGKSALVAALVPGIHEAGRKTVLIELHDRQRRLPASLRRMPGLEAGTVVIVDGYEQLAWWNRVTLGWFCRRRGLGLLVTSHASVGLPDLFRTTTSLALARQIVDQLLAEDPGAVTPGEVDERFRLHHGNMREVLFDLYDLYQRRRPQQQC